MCQTCLSLFMGVLYCAWNAAQMSGPIEQPAIASCTMLRPNGVASMRPGRFFRRVKRMCCPDAAWSSTAA